MTLAGIEATMLAPGIFAACNVSGGTPETNLASPYPLIRAFSNVRCDYRRECEALGYLDPTIGFVCREDADAFPAGSCIRANFFGFGVCEWINASNPANKNQSSENNDGPDKSCIEVGNPINAGTGDKHQNFTDYDFGGAPSTGLSLRRHYHSSNFASGTGSFGLGWTSSYTQSVRVFNNLSGISSNVHRPDGGEFVFRFNNGAWTSDADVNGKLAEIKDASNNRTGWRYLVAKDGATEDYDAAGKLLKITSRTGTAELMTYAAGTGGGNPPTAPVCQGVPGALISPQPDALLCVTDTFGRQLNFAYDIFGRVIKLADPAGGTYTYEYDAPTAGNHLLSATYPDGRTANYLYENASLSGALTGITDENGVRYATWSYDPQGRAISSEHAGGANLTTLTYNASSTTVTDALNTTRVYGLQTILGVVRGKGVSQPGGSGCAAAASSVTYDANGNLSSYLDFNGTQTDYTFDLTRNLEIQRIEGVGSPDARTVNTQWHSYWRLPVKLARPLKLTTWVYNGEDSTATCAPADAVVPTATGTQAIGVLCKRIEQATSDVNGSQGFGAPGTGTARTWSYTYNANGRVLTVDGPRADVSDVTTYTYHANSDPDPGKRGNVAIVTNALGQVTSIGAYNAHGQPLNIVDPNGLSTTLTYDARQRLISRSVGEETTTYDYDRVGLMTKVTLPDGSYISYTYDPARRLTGFADALGNTVLYTLDPLGNRLREEVRDPVNQLAQIRQRVFDPLNRLARDIGAVNQTTIYAYDPNGNLTTVVDPLAHITINAYDALNRLVQVTDPNNGQTRYGYNGLDRLISVTDPRNLATTYSYDGLANLNQQQSPDTGTTANTYDEAGNLVTQTDANGQITSYAYDALNRVTSISFHDGSKQTYAYDQGANAIGRLSSITETNPGQQVTSVLAYAYDQKGRTTSETRTINGIAYVHAYSYDAAGRLSGLTYPSGRTIAYTFNALGRVSQVSTTPLGGAAQIVASNIAYQPFGGVKSYTLGNGQTYTRGFDLDGRIASYNLGSQFFALGYDEASRISFITDAGNPSNSNTYSYDNLDRLIGAVLPNLPFAYNYDAVGNRTSKTVGSATDTYAYDATSNRISSITAPAGVTRSFTFDDNGATTNDGFNQYVYDTRGRLAQSIGPQGLTPYHVNALGQRIRKSNTTEDRVYLYDTRGRLIAETDPDGILRREYLYLNDIPLAVIQ